MRDGTKPIKTTIVRSLTRNQRRAVARLHRALDLLCDAVDLPKDGKTPAPAAAKTPAAAKAAATPQDGPRTIKLPSGQYLTIPNEAAWVEFQKRTGMLRTPDSSPGKPQV